MEQLCRRLQTRGHQITVITGASVRVHGRKNVRGPIGWSDHGGLRVLRVPLAVIGEGESFLDRILTYISFNVLAFFTVCFCGRQDIVVSPSPPLTNGVISWLIGALKRAPAVYNVQDLVPEAYIQFGVLKNRMVIKTFERLERFVYRKNDCITVISDSFASHLRGKEVPDAKIKVIPNFVDTDEIEELPRDNELSRKLGLEGRFVVMHAGSIAYRHGVEVLVDAAEILSNDERILFLIVGEGSKRRAVEERANAAGLTNFRMLPYLDRSELGLLRACADVQMIVLRKGMTSHSVPCKVYEIMASGRPFIAAVDEGSTIWDIAREASCGLTVAPESAEEIAAAIRRLHADRQLACRMGANGRAHALEHFSAEAVGRQYDELFRRLTATHQNG